MPRSILIPFILLVAGASLTAQVPPRQAMKLPASAETPHAQESPFKTAKLDNGLEVIVIEDHSLPIVTIDLAVNTGAFTEPDSMAGLSHLYEHMFFKANRAIPSQEAFMRRTRELGIVYNGYTTNETVTYFFTLPSKNLTPGMEFMGNAIKSPAFVPEELTRERQVVLGEFDRNEASPEFALRYAMDSAMWMPYVSRKQALGQRGIISTATVQKMEMIRNRFYIPNNSALIVSGNVDAEQVFDLARRYFSDWQQGPEPFPQFDPPAFPPLRSQLVVREARVPDVLLRVRWFGPSIGKDESDPQIAQLFATLISQPTSRFYRNLIDSGLVVQGGFYAENARFTGTLNFSLRTSPDLAIKAMDAIKREIAAMGQPGYFSDEEIEVGKQIIADRGLFERDDLFSFTTNTVARWWTMASLDYYLDFPNVVSKVTPEQITEFAREWITGQPVVVGIGASRAVLDKLNLTPEVLK